MTIRPLARAAAALAVAAAVVLIGAQAASAHDSLVAASPGPDDTVTELADVTLTFSDNLLGLGAGNIVVVIGPDGRHYESDCTALAGPTLTTRVALGAAGRYEVTWRAVSSDGHPVSDTYAFSYAPAAGTEAAEGSDGPVCATDPVSEEAPTADAATTPSPGIDGLTLGLVVGGGAVVLIAIVVIVILRTRDRDGDAGTEEQ